MYTITREFFAAPAASWCSAHRLSGEFDAAPRAMSLCYCFLLHALLPRHGSPCCSEPRVFRTNPKANVNSGIVIERYEPQTAPELSSLQRAGNPLAALLDLSPPAWAAANASFVICTTVPGLAAPVASHWPSVPLYGNITLVPKLATHPDQSAAPIYADPYCRGNPTRPQTPRVNRLRTQSLACSASNLHPTEEHPTTTPVEYPYA